MNAVATTVILVSLAALLAMFAVACCFGAVLAAIALFESWIEHRANDKERN